MVPWPTRDRRLHTLKADLSHTECIDKYFDHANWLALVNEVIEAFGQRTPPRSTSSTKRFVDSPKRITEKS